MIYEGVFYKRLNREDMEKIKKLETTELVKEITFIKSFLWVQVSRIDIEYRDALCQELHKRLEEGLVDERLANKIKRFGIPEDKLLIKAMRNM